MDQAEKLRNIIKGNRISVAGPRARVIAVTSGKGGVGKSTVSTNLAVDLSRRGKRVIIFDADFGLANVEVMYGMAPRYTLNDVIYKGKSMTDIITRGPANVGFISGGSGIVTMNNPTDYQRSFLLDGLSELDSAADFIIIDTAAGVSSNVMDFVANCPEVLLVTTPDPSSLTDAYSLVKVLALRQSTDGARSQIKVVANRVADRQEGDSIYSKLNIVSKRFLGIGLSYMGYIPMDQSLEKAVRSQKPVVLAYPESKSSLAIKNIAASLLQVPETAQKKRGISQLISRLFNSRNQERPA